MDEDKTKSLLASLDMISLIIALLTRYLPGLAEMIAKTKGMTDEQVAETVAYLLANPMKTFDEALEDVRKEG